MRAVDQLEAYAGEHRRSGESEAAALARACAERPHVYAQAQRDAVENEPPQPLTAAEPPAWWREDNDQLEDARMRATEAGLGLNEWLRTREGSEFYQQYDRERS